ncbi:MAG: hypothetical protein E7330_08295 [Clostridiales bacterium]|nr:hypothetical protein [Clostridiales bacterium]
MERIEMVEKLVEKTGVSYAEAKAALEENGWDMLDALIALEKSGKVHGKKTTASYSTASEQKKEPENTSKTDDAGSGWEDFKRGFIKLIKKGMVNSFVVTRRGEEIINLPVLILLIVACFCFWLLLPLLLIGLFFECRYSFQGEDLGKKDVNDAMHKASSYAEDLKQNMKTGFNEDKKE